MPYPVWEGSKARLKSPGLPTPPSLKSMFCKLLRKIVKAALWKVKLGNESNVLGVIP